MKDKNLVALLTVLFFLTYFLPWWIIKLISLGFILFFAPGFFTIRIYKDLDPEELVLISPPLSLGISGLIAVVLAALSILTPYTMLITVGAYLCIAYALSSGGEIKRIKWEKPSKFVSAVIILSIILISVWGYAEFTASPRHEVDISIESWPHNATVGKNVSFELMVKNWNYGDSDLKIIFKLNNIKIGTIHFHLSNGQEKEIKFETSSTVAGKNLASFDLYVNGHLYTNVHVYFMVKPKK